MTCGSRLLAGDSGVHPVRLCDTSDLKVKIGGDIYDWDPSAYIDSKEAKRIDRFTQFALVAGTDAVRDSGIDLSREDSVSLRSRAGFGHRRALRNRSADEPADDQRSRPRVGVHRAEDDAQRGRQHALDRLRHSRPELRDRHGLCQRHQCHGRRPEADSG